MFSLELKCDDESVPFFAVVSAIVFAESAVELVDDEHSRPENRRFLKNSNEFGR